MGAGATEAYLCRSPRIARGRHIKTLRLKKKEDRRLRRGHPWAFSNEFETSLAGLEPGELVQVTGNDGRPIGVGYANPHSLIAVRLLARDGEEVGPALIRDRIASARRLREGLYPGRTSYRAVYSESDFLPGLIADRYGPWLSVQSLTAGIERLLPDILQALTDEYRPEGIVLRNDSKLRSLEGLPLEKKVVSGSYAGPVEIGLAGLRFKVDLQDGQKTGFFLDQVDNYGLLERTAGGGQALDIFCYTGAWTLSAARAGAGQVLGIDASAPALALAQENASLNGLSEKTSFEREDAFSALTRLTASGERFDLVVADPPAFIKSRARVQEGLKGYRELNTKAMRLVRPGGWLITCSCSHHLDREAFREMLKMSSVAAGRTARLFEMRSQSKDHPVLIAAPETEYLKCALLQVL